MSTAQFEFSPIDGITEIKQQLLQIFWREGEQISELWDVMDYVVVEEGHMGALMSNLQDFIGGQRRLEITDLAALLPVTINCCVCAKRAWELGMVDHAWHLLVGASKLFGMLMVMKRTCHSEAEAKAVRMEVAKAGAMARLANDPVQRSKEAARLLWLEHSEPAGLSEYRDWQKRKPGERRSNASFARFLCDKFGFLNQKTVEGWLTQWGSHN